MLPASQTRDRIREGRTEVRVGGAAVARPPAGIHRELFKIRKPSSLGDERDLARRQGSEVGSGQLPARPSISNRHSGKPRD